MGVVLPYWLCRMWYVGAVPCGQEALLETGASDTCTYITRHHARHACNASILVRTLCAVVRFMHDINVCCVKERETESVSLCVLFIVCAYDWHCGGGCIDIPWRVLARCTGGTT